MIRRDQPTGRSPARSVATPMLFAAMLLGATLLAALLLATGGGADAATGVGAASTHGGGASVGPSKPSRPVLAGGVAASPPVVVAFPGPGEQVASPQTQIAFRNVDPAALQSVTVSGSQSGAHAGRIEADSDGKGGSFLPSKSFDPGETVTVTAPFAVVGTSGSSYQFTVADPAGQIVPRQHLFQASRVRGDVWRFRSAPNLAPAAVRVSRRSSSLGSSDIFLTPQYGPVQNGLMILDAAGRLVWFQPLSGNVMASDLAVQRYHGRPVLTWWQGTTGAGVGLGTDYIYSTSYRQIATVNAANGLHADLHEFELTPSGTALLTAYSPVYWNASSVHGPSRQAVLDAVVQEIDIPTGLVLFQWDSLDHVSLGDSYQKVPSGANRLYDYFHVNAVALDGSGNLLISARNTWAAYAVSHATGNVLWTLGGKHSTFKLGSGASFAFEHDVRPRASGDSYVTMFDDGAGPPRVHSQSRGLKLALNFKSKTATVAAQYEHVPPLVSDFQGNVQQLPGYNEFVGWGQEPYFSEYNSRGSLVLDGRFVADTASYRAFRFSWNATPAAPPAVAASTSRSHTTVYASWNGATAVARWRVMAGTSQSALRSAKVSPRTGFETAIAIAPAKYVKVQALDARGRVMGTSAVVAVR